MKLVNLFLIANLLLAVACNSGSDKKDKDDKEDKSKTETTTSKDEDVLKTDASILACEEFLDDYETWVDEVVKVYEQLHTDPMNVDNSQKVMDAGTQMASWSEKWYKLAECAHHPQYEERMEALAEKLEDAMNPAL